MLLRYVTWMQRGIKQASDSYARFMASIGSLERVVELHDRGVFRDAAQQKLLEALPVPATQGATAPAGDAAASESSSKTIHKQWRWKGGRQAADREGGGGVQEPLLVQEQQDGEQQETERPGWMTSWWTAILQQPLQWQSWFLGKGPYPLGKVKTATSISGK